MRDRSYLKEFRKNIQCPKCLSKNIKMRLVTICGPPAYIRWECLKCGFYEHMKPADVKKAEGQKVSILLVSPLEESSNALAAHYEIKFSQPVNGQWVWELLEKAIKQYFQKIKELKERK